MSKCGGRPHIFTPLSLGGVVENYLFSYLRLKNKFQPKKKNQMYKQKLSLILDFQHYKSGIKKLVGKS
jgi:hypothetical protein